MSSVIKSVTPQISNLNVVLKASLNRFHGLNVSFLNIRSLLPKLDQVSRLIHDVKLDVLCFAETHIYEHIPDASVNLNGFDIYRNDRKGKRGGGICMYVRNYIRSSLVYSYSSDNIQVLFIELYLNGSNILMGLCYKPPRLTFTDEFDKIFSDLSVKYSDIIIVGDFNSNYLNQSPETRKFIAIIKNLSLKFVNTTEATHFPSYGNCSLLDMVITNTDKIIFFNQISCGFADHDMIFCCYDTKLDRTPVNITYRNFKAINIASLLEECSCLDWAKLFTLSKIDDIIEYFNSKIVNLFDSYVPLKTIKSRLRYAPWFSNEIDTAIILRDHALHIWMHSKDYSDRREFKKLRNIVTKLIRNAKSEFFNKHIIIPSEKSTSFWNKVKKLGLKKRDKIKNCKIDPNVFCNFIASASVANNSISNISSTEFDNNIGFSFQNVDADIVTRALFSVKSNSVGLDGIPLKFIKLLYPIIQPYLVYMFNNILTKSTFPSQWKTAKIIPLPKCNEAVKPSDFRPISILPGLSKVFEKIVKNQICAHLERNSLLNVNQSAFREGHSTTTALLNIVNDLMQNIDKGLFNILVLFDFSKAFDAISHTILCDKLISMFGFSSSAVKLIFSYLTDRYYEVHADAVISKCLKVRAGVPQGSVLGPILFLIYINDLPNAIRHSKYHIFADDLQIYKSLQMGNCCDNIKLINQDIKSIVEWSQENCLSLNATKMKAIAINNSRIDICNLPDILVGNDKICYTNNVRNLGLFFDNSMSWSSHINHVSKKINFMLRCLWSTTKMLNIESRKKIFQAFLLPHFMYCDSIIFGMSQIQFNKVKLVFNRCVRYVFKLKKYDRVSKFTCDLIGCNLFDLFKLRVCCQIFKIIKFRKPIYLYRKLSRLKSSRLNNLSIERNKHKLLNQSFFVRGITFWNSLPLKIKNSNSVVNFKKNYATFHNLKILDSRRQTI